MSINKDQTVRIRCVGDGIFRSLGSIFCKSLINGDRISHTFLIVDNDFPIPSDGIIGLDFIKSKNCLLDYSNANSLLIIRSYKMNAIEIPIIDLQTPQDFTVPARSETFRKIYTLEPTQSYFISNQELDDGVLVPNCIVSGENPYIRILNTSAKKYSY